MNTLVLNALEQDDPRTAVRKAVLHELTEKGFTNEEIDMQQANISACLSCGACSLKTPGKCVQKDDMEAIITSWVRSNLVVFITKITFGGYSSTLKKAVDRLLVLKLPLFEIYKGELHHRNRYGTSQSLLTVGILDSEADDSQARVFEQLTRRNAVNFKAENSHAVILCKEEAADTLHEKLYSALESLEVKI